MGNSEVGQLNIGAGRVVYQEFTRIDRAIESGYFYTNPALLTAVHLARDNGRTQHVLGLLSDGGVHSHESQFHALLDLAAREGLHKVCLHVFLDGRDTPPKSAEIYLRRLNEKIGQTGVGHIASMIGRYFAMDRDRRWQRVKTTNDRQTQGRAEFMAENALTGLEAAYARGETDEFVKATAILPPDGKPVKMEDGDSVIFLNFRSDRARQLSRPFIEPDFSEFEREVTPRLAT